MRSSVLRVGRVDDLPCPADGGGNQADDHVTAHRFRLDANLAFVEGNAESLGLPENGFDAYTIAFGIRNVTDIPAALKEAHRVLKRGTDFDRVVWASRAANAPGYR